MEARCHRVGASALLVEFEDRASTQAAYPIIRAMAVGPRRPVDVVPAARTVLVDGIDQVAWEPALEAALRDPAGAGEPLVTEPRRQLVVPARYDGSDLGVVAREWGCTPEQVVRRHLAATFTVAFCGFAPGFAYCETDDLPPVRRRADPRPWVPAGSIALAGEYCGIYPRRMPGGWQLIGTTQLTMFDTSRAEPATLRPGDRIRFDDATAGTAR